MTQPICFGMATAVSDRCETCRQCAQRLACCEQAIAFVEQLPDAALTRRERLRLSKARQRLDVGGADPGAGEGGGEPAAVLSSAQRHKIEGMGKAVKSIATRMFDSGWFDFAQRELAAGRNPGGKPWQRILFDALLGGGISRSGLQLAYQEQLGMTPGSAQVRASKAVSVFRSGGLLVERDGRLLPATSNLSHT